MIQLKKKVIINYICVHSGAMARGKGRSAFLCANSYLCVSVYPLKVCVCCKTCIIIYYARARSRRAAARARDDNLREKGRRAGNRLVRTS